MAAKKAPAKRKKTGGRQKGTPNKTSAELKEAILSALHKAGGEEYLVKLAKDSPAVFARLLEKLLPQQVTGSEGKDLFPDGFKITVVKNAGD